MNAIDELLVRYPILEVCKADMQEAFELISNCFMSEHKLLVAGNGGSAADAEHVCGELMKGFVKKRHLSDVCKEKLKAVDSVIGSDLADKLQGGLPTIALTSQMALNTAIINDIDGDYLYAQQVNGYGVSGDVFWGISTSGNSKNIINAAIVAKAKGMRVVALTGKDGGKIKDFADVSIIVPEMETYMIQELHLPVYHAMCLMLENYFFEV